MLDDNEVGTTQAVQAVSVSVSSPEPEISLATSRPIERAKDESIEEKECKNCESVKNENAKLKSKIESLETQLALKNSQIEELQAKYDQLVIPKEETTLLDQNDTFVNPLNEESEESSKVDEPTKEQELVQESQKDQNLTRDIPHINVNDTAVQDTFDDINDLEQALEEKDGVVNLPLDQELQVNGNLSPSKASFKANEVQSPELTIPPRSERRNVREAENPNIESRLSVANSVSSSLYGEIKSPLKLSPLKMRSSSANSLREEERENLTSPIRSSANSVDEVQYSDGVIMGSSPRKRASRKGSPLFPISPLRKEVFGSNLTESISDIPSLKDVRSGMNSPVAKVDKSAQEDFYFSDNGSSPVIQDKPAPQPYYLSSSASPIKRRETDPDASGDIYSAYLDTENTSKGDDDEPAPTSQNDPEKIDFNKNEKKNVPPPLDLKATTNEEPKEFFATSGIQKLPPKTPIMEQLSRSDENAPQLDSPDFGTPFNATSNRLETDSLYSDIESPVQQRTAAPETPTRGAIIEYDNDSSPSSIVQTPTQKRFASPFLSPTRPANLQLPQNTPSNYQNSFSPVQSVQSNSGSQLNRAFLPSPQQFHDRRMQYSPSLSNSVYSNNPLSPSFSSNTPRSNLNAFLPSSAPLSRLSSPQNVRYHQSKHSFDNAPDYLSETINNTKIILDSIVDPEAMLSKSKDADTFISFSVTHFEKNSSTLLYRVKQPYSLFLKRDLIFRSLETSFTDNQGMERIEKPFFNLPELPSRESFLTLDPRSWDSKKTIIRMYVDELCRLIKQFNRDSVAWKLFNSFFQPYVNVEDDPNESRFYFLQASKMKKGPKLWVATINTVSGTVTVQEYGHKAATSDIFQLQDLQVTEENQVLTFQRKKKNVFKSKGLVLYAESIEDGRAFVNLINKYAIEIVKDEQSSLHSSEQSVLSEDVPSTPKSQPQSQDMNSSNSKSFFKRRTMLPAAKGAANGLASVFTSSTTTSHKNSGSEVSSLNGTVTSKTSDSILDFKAMSYSNPGVLHTESNGSGSTLGQTIILPQQATQPVSSTFTKAVDPMSKMFGSTLEKGLELSPEFEIDGKRVPAVVFRSIDYLKKQKAVYHEGIFRLNGMMLEVNKIQQVFEEEHDCDYFALQDPPDVHSVATLLKRYLRTLQTMIIPDSESKAILSLCASTEYEDSVPKIKKVLESLPQVNQDTLAAIFNYIQEVLKYRSYNKMSIFAVSVLMSPNISNFDGDRIICTELLINHSYYFQGGRILTEEERKLAH